MLDSERGRGEEQKTVVRVSPTERFHLRGAGRRLVRTAGPLYFRRSRYYHCPECGRKTLVNRRRLDAFNPPPSVFQPDLEILFDRVELTHHEAAYDFFCRGCQRPVRLVYWSQERGMGGPWDSYVIAVLELEGEHGGV